MKILIVEDDQPLLEVLKICFENSGEAVLEAPDGEQALSRARNEQPDFIVLDTSLPLRDGFEVCRALKDDPDTSNIPVMMLCDSANDRERCQRVGAVACLLKPFSPLGLLAEIRARNRHNTAAPAG